MTGKKTGLGMAAFTSPACWPGESEKVIAFSLGGRHCYMPLETIIEIVCLMKIDSALAIPPYIQGAICLRGEYLPIVDLHSMLGIKWLPTPEEESADSCVIVTGLQWGRLRLDLGVPADEILGMATFPEESEKLFKRSGSWSDQPGAAPLLVNLKSLLGSRGFLLAHKVVEERRANQ